MQKQEKMIYLDCSSGISGDMTVAALLDLGGDPEHLVKTLESLPLDGWKAEISNVTKSGLRVCDFNVILSMIIMTMIWSIFTDTAMKSMFIMTVSIKTDIMDGIFRRSLRSFRQEI